MGSPAHVASHVGNACDVGKVGRGQAVAVGVEQPEDRPDIAELLPVEDFHPFLELAPVDASILIAGEEDVTPALHDHWQDVCAAFHDRDAHHLYVDPETIGSVLTDRARIHLSSIDQDQPFSFRAQAANEGL